MFAVEADPELRSLYQFNHRVASRSIAGDIRDAWEAVPAHDVLCAGFPCQPFSKSGAQLGRLDVTRGTLFDFVLKIIDARKPRLVLLENVGNFAKHDEGNTWRVVRKSLVSRGYEIAGTEHIHQGGRGLLSPHHFGFPQIRERFYAVAARGGFSGDPLPAPRRVTLATSMSDLLTPERRLSAEERAECSLSEAQIACIDLWNEFVRTVPASIELPAFPIWSDEFGATYPTEKFLSRARTATLSRYVALSGTNLSRQELLDRLPGYARNGQGLIPHWKRRFIEQNREFFSRVRPHLRRSWLDEIRSFPSSLRKLEWNCQGEERDLWKCVLQFRPSGLRARRGNAIPALVAMTTTQVPIVGRRRRYITRLEAARFQGMPDTMLLPDQRAKAFQALGNAVHTGVVDVVYRHALSAVGSCANNINADSGKASNGERYGKDRLAV